MDEMKRISDLEERKGRLALGKEFGVSVENEEIDLRGSIHLDYLYDTFTFAVKKGFPWEQCYHTVKFAKELLDETVGRTIAEAVQIYTKKCLEYRQNVSSKNLEAYTKFFFQSFMVHYQLYQYVFNQNRMNQTYKMSKTVEMPPEPQRFILGKPAKIWDYEQKIKDIDDLLQKREMERQEKEKDNINAVQGIYDELHLEPPMDLEKMRTLINDVAKAHLSTATNHLETNISETMQDIELMLQKSSIPKPLEMVAPSSPYASEGDDELPELGMTFGKRAGAGRTSSVASRGPGQRSSLASRGPGPMTSAASSRGPSRNANSNRGPSRTATSNRVPSQTSKSRVSFRLKSESRAQSNVPPNKKKASTSKQKSVGGI